MKAQEVRLGTYCIFTKSCFICNYCYFSFFFGSSVVLLAGSATPSGSVHQYLSVCYLKHASVLLSLAVIFYIQESVHIMIRFFLRLSIDICTNVRRSILATHGKGYLYFKCIHFSHTLPIYFDLTSKICIIS